MQATIDAPYKDTSSEELSWAWGLGPQEALSVKTLRFGDTQVEMRLLGASHQIVVTADGERYSEVVACLEGAGEKLPPLKNCSSNYNFASTVHKLDNNDFKIKVQAIKDKTSANDQALSAIFPGSPDALTAMLVETREGLITWTTWHAYPQHNEIVETRSTLLQ